MNALAEAGAGDQRQHLSSQPDLDPAEIWGERAQQLVEYVKSNKPPVAKKSSVHVFAMRKGWETATLVGILKYCVDQKLLVAYQAVSGAAFKIPMTPVFDVADGDAPTDRLAAGAVREQRHVEPRSRTAPAANYGCPVHGGARTKTKPKKERTTMAKDWITTAEAGELLGLGQNRVCVLLKEKQLTGRVDDAHEGGGRKPFVISRASVVGLIEKRKGDMFDEPKAKPAKPAKVVTSTKIVKVTKPATSVMRRASKPAGGGRTIIAKLADEIGALREDVITLVRVVDRGWMSQDEAFAKLREISESL